MQVYYSGNLGGAVMLQCVSTLTERGGSRNLDDFWNQSSKDFCWNFLEMGGFLKIRLSINIITGNLYIECCARSLAMNPHTPVTRGKYKENLRFEILTLAQSRCNEALSRLQMSEGLQYTFLQLIYSLSFMLSSLHKT